MGQMTSEPCPDFEEISQLLRYDPATGELRWLVSRSRLARAGDIAGTVTKQGYVAIILQGRGFKAHRIAWLLHYGNWPAGHIDHINGSKADNRIANLRDVDRRVNAENLREPLRREGRTSRFLGVHFNSVAKKWIASIRVHRKLKHLGCFQVEEDAARAYVDAKRRLHEGCTL